MWDNFFKTEDHTDKFDQEDINKNKILASIAYFGILFFIPMVLGKKSPFARFHALQGLLMTITLLITGLIVGLLCLILQLVPDLGQIFGGLAVFSMSVLFLIIMVFGIVTTLKGKAMELPLIGPSKMASYNGKSAERGNSEADNNAQEKETNGTDSQE